MPHARRWGAVYILLLLFLGSWLGQFFAHLHEFRAEVRSRGAEFVWIQFLSAFSGRTLENWQSEWLQLIFEAVLLLGARHWLFKLNAEDTDRLESKIDRLQQSLDAHAAESGRPVPHPESARHASSDDPPEDPPSEAPGRTRDRG
ncbi:MAG: DUF6766 family protein [Micromonosporaceae bacterium]